MRGLRVLIVSYVEGTVEGIVREICVNCPIAAAAGRNLSRPVVLRCFV
jgi:hypothetical protein